MEYTPERGRHLRAAKALQIGEVSFCILLVGGIGGIYNKLQREVLVCCTRQTEAMDDAVIQTMTIVKDLERARQRCKKITIGGGCGGGSGTFSSHPGLA